MVLFWASLCVIHAGLLNFVPCTSCIPVLTVNLYLKKMIIFVLDMVAEEQVKERAVRAAAAARRWREYSRRGADKPPTYKLPQAMDASNKD